MTELFKWHIKQEKLFCPIHGTYEAESMEMNDLVVHSECPECTKLKKVQFNKDKIERVNSSRIDRFRESNIEPEYYFKTLEDYIPQSESQTKAKNAVSEMIKNKKGKVVLLGSNGTGKTLLASIAAMALGGRIYTMYEISTMIRQSYTIKAERSELEIVRELAELPFLAIDELSRIKVSEAELNWRSFILDKRHTRKLPTMLIDNGHFKKDCPNGGCSKCFENLLDNDILSRLRQDTTFVVMDDTTDFRKRSN